MSGTLTPEEPRTPVLSPDVDDLFNLAAPPVEQAVAKLVPVQSHREAIAVNVGDVKFVLGRGKELNAPYRINDAPKLSSRHCEIRLDPASMAIYVKDISTNGTFVNGRRLSKEEEVHLQDGDTIALSKPLPANTSSAADVEQVEYMLQRLRAETSVSKLVEELTCPVCRAIYVRPCSMLPCMHVVCASCVSQWLREGHKECVECRRPIEEVRPTHKIQNCVEQLLAAEPQRRRSEEELRTLEAVDDIPPGGKIIAGVKRERDTHHGGGGGGSDDDWNSDDDDDQGSEDDVGVAAGPLRHHNVMFHVNGPNPQGVTGARCGQCVTPSTVDGFQCAAGGPHLSCRACARAFPERPLCGRAQRCWLCSAPYCNLYFAQEGGCPAQGVARRFQALESYAFDAIPSNTFGGNVTEQMILTNYMASNTKTAAEVWAECLAKLRDGTWKPDLTSINGPVEGTSPMCDRCASSTFAALLFHYRRAIPRDELPENVTKRSNCWYGLQCRTQFHKPQHAQTFNHICYQEKRKE